MIPGNAILVIDDSQMFAEGMVLQLERRGYTVHRAATGQEGVALAARISPRLIFLDLRLADMQGIEVLGRVKGFLPDVDVAIMTGYPELTSARAAIKERVLDYLVKPFTSVEIDNILRRAFGDATAAPLPTRANGVDMVGSSPALAQVRQLIRTLAQTGVRAALIGGESGTGKELAARMLHAQSPRADRPFVDVNCSAVSETLFESEFFGHERGAFTGAVAARQGLCELANGGTLFLDEVGEIPLSCQAKLLRFLDDQTFVRVGGTRKIRVDVQILAATNRDLRTMVEQWTFRQDLYFRLNVAAVHLPPLRERREDILPLAHAWLADANERYGKRVRGFTPDAEAVLRAYAWPGNVRELRNTIERSVILTAGELLTPAHFPAEIPRAAEVFEDGAIAPLESPIASLEAMEQLHIRSVLGRVGGNKTRAAEILGISRQTLRAKLTSA